MILFLCFQLILFPLVFFVWVDLQTTLKYTIDTMTDYSCDLFINLIYFQIILVLVDLVCFLIIVVAKCKLRIFTGLVVFIKSVMIVFYFYKLTGSSCNYQVFSNVFTIVFLFSCVINISILFYLSGKKCCN